MKRRSVLAVSALIIGLIHAVSITPSSKAATSYLSGGNYYAYETYLSSGTWTRPYGVSQIDYLVVGGGGRGGGSQLSTHYAGGGGGGGGVRYGTVNVAQSSYSITVGAGQAVGCSQGRGGNSTLSGADISTISATGGGSGSCNASTSGGGGGIDGYSGGSGGGAGAQVGAWTYGSGNAGGYSPAEGYAGGTSYAHSTDATYQGGGGGGGATQAGANATAACAGRGGDGYSSSITGTALIYGGGGGGGTRMNSCGGGGGAGGGGAGGLNGAQGSAGTDGRGGGGGGTSLYNGNKGGDGTVIVRYLLTAPTTPTLSSANDTGKSNSDGITSATSFSLTGIAIGGSTIQLYNGASAIGSACTANTTTGAYSCALTGLTAGTYTFTAKASFGAGAAITSSSSLTVIIDTSYPALNPSTTFSIQENQTSITTITSDETVTMTMTGGVDSLTVNFDTSTGVLSFKVAADFEAPIDSNQDNSYTVRIQVTDTAGNFRWREITFTVININESSNVGSPTISGTAYKGVTTPLVVTSNVAGKVRFYIDGKRIPNCLSVATVGTYPNFTATCNWKPAVTNKHSVKASITPTDNSFSASYSDQATIWIYKRATTR